MILFFLMLNMLRQCIHIIVYMYICIYVYILFCWRSVLMFVITAYSALCLHMAIACAIIRTVKLERVGNNA